MAVGVSKAKQVSRQELAYQEEGSVVDNFMVTQGQCQK